MELPNEFMEIDASAVRKLKETHGWIEFIRSIDLWIDDLRDHLEDSSELSEQHRGSLKALRLIQCWTDVVEAQAEYAQLNNPPQVGKDAN